MWKVLHNGSVIDVLTRALWVHQGPGLLLLCEDQTYEGQIPETAQGVISRDESTAYQLEDRNKLDDADLLEVSVVFISDQEGQALLEQLEAGQTPDPEDTDPVPPEGGSTDDLMTRAQLTAKVKALEASNARLEEELQAAKILLGVDE